MGKYSGVFLEPLGNHNSNPFDSWEAKQMLTLEYMKSPNISEEEWNGFSRLLEIKGFGEKIWDELSKSNNPIVFGPIKKVIKNDEYDRRIVTVNVYLPMEIVPYRKIELPKIEHVYLKLSFWQRLQFLFTNKLPGIP